MHSDFSATLVGLDIAQIYAKIQKKIKTEGKNTLRMAVVVIKLASHNDSTECATT